MGYLSNAGKRRNHYRVNTGQSAGSGVASHTPAHMKKFSLSKIKKSS